MQQRGNVVAFMVLSLAVLMGYIYLQEVLWPRRAKDADQKEKKKDEPAVNWKKVGPAANVANLVANRVSTGDHLVEAALLGSDYQLVEPSSPAPAAPDYVKDGAYVAGRVAGESVTVPEANAQFETIGGPDYFLEAKLTTRGAGVQALWLNQFEAADYLGKPVPGKTLELIQEDPITPSFLLYHYPNSSVKPTDPAPKSDDPNNKAPRITLGATNWKLDGKTEKANGIQEVKFSTPINDPNYKDLFLIKTYRLEPKAYHLTLILDIENRGPAGGKAVSFRYQLTGSHGMPLEGEWYTATHRDALIALVDPNNNVERTRQDAMSVSFKEGGNPVPETAVTDRYLQYAGVSLQYFSSVIAVDPTFGRNQIAWARPTKESSEVAGRILGVGGNALEFVDANSNEDTFLMLPRVAKQVEKMKLGQGSKVVVSYYTTIDRVKVATWIRLGNTQRNYFDDITVRVTSEEITIEPGKKATHQYTLYHGPSKVRLLGQFGGDKAVPSELVTRYADEQFLYTLTDYASDNWFGSVSRSIGFTSLLIFVTNLMHFLLHWLSYLGGYGIAIILLTVLVRGIMFPISRKQALFSMRMQQLGPELKKIQEKYKGDPRAKTEATMEFYRKHKINPFASCLPLLLQMPIFLGLYFTLQESIHFRLAGFLWIDNLAAPDMLLYWSQSIPWISDPDNIGGMFYLGPYFNLLPLIAVGLMVLQQKMMSPPAMDEQQAMQMKVMRFMMIFMAVLFYKVAAGLAIYFIASSLWGVAERRLLPKTQPIIAGGPGGKGPPPSGAMVPTKGGPGGKGGPGRPGNNKPKTPEPEDTSMKGRIKKWWADVLDKAKKK